MARILNVVVRPHLHGFVFGVFVRRQWKLCERRRVQLAGAFRTGLIAVAFHGPAVHLRQQRAQPGIQRPQRVEGLMTDAGKQSPFHDEHAVFCFRLIFRFIRAGLDNYGTVVLCLRLVAVIDYRFIAVGFLQRASEVVRDKQFWHAAQEGQAAAVGIEPLHNVLAFTGINVGVI